MLTEFTRSITKGAGITVGALAVLILAIVLLTRVCGTPLPGGAIPTPTPVPTAPLPMGCSTDYYRHPTLGFFVCN